MKKQDKFELLMEDFFKYINEKEINIYNEFSFQHELGIYLRMTFPNYKVEFERNASKHLHINYDKVEGENEEKVKKEIDIYIYNKDDNSEKYAIELKYPLNGQVPEQMYQFTKDVKFMQFLKNKGFNKTYCVVLVDNKNFYEGPQKGREKNGRVTDIYKYFRKDNNTEIKPLTGKIEKPTGEYQSNRPFINLEKEYSIIWKTCKITQTENDVKTKTLTPKMNECKYFVIECK